MLLRRINDYWGYIGVGGMRKHRITETPQSACITKFDRGLANSSSK